MCGKLLKRGVSVCGKPCPVHGGDTAAAHPRTNSVEILATTQRDFARSGVFNDLTMASHSPIMHYALQDCKRLLHYDSDYDFWMQTPNERLRFARRPNVSMKVNGGNDDQRSRNMDCRGCFWVDRLWPYLILAVHCARRASAIGAG